MIKDSDIKRILQSGPATIGQISRVLMIENPTASRNRIYHDVGLKARQLVKYRILVTIQSEGVEYYALPENTDLIAPYVGPRPHHKIRAYIEALPDGATLTYNDITARFGVCRYTAYTTLKTTPRIHKKSLRPAVFVKGA